jgi:hypothetical protein
MDGLQPLVLEVFDKDFQYQATVGRPQALVMTARRNGVGTGAFVLDSDDEAAEALAEPGALLTCHYRHDPDDPLSPMYFLGGPVTQVDLGGVLSAPTQAFTVKDHWDILSTFPCRAVPASTGWASQGTASTIYTSTGPAETVVKDLITKNLSLVPTPITVVPTHGWGEDITVQVRDNLLVDKIFPALNYAHVGITVQQGPSGLIVDARQQTVHTVPLTPESGILASLAGSLLRPTVSRVMVRGGEDLSTVRRLVVNTAVEDVWRYCGYATVEVPESTTADYLDAKGWEVLNAGSRQASLAIELAETDDWRFGEGEDFFGLGDEMPVMAGGVDLGTHAITEVEIKWERGLTVTSRVGERPLAPDKAMAKAVEQVARSVRIDRARG